MTLSETIKAIEIIASHQPSINSIVRNDIYRLNSLADVKYGVFGWTQEQHSSDLESNTFSFVFFYIDRLKANKSNQIEVQSVGFETLSNIIRTLNEKGFAVDSFTYNTFNQRFLDECCGGWARVRIDVPVGYSCEELFPDFDDDYNEDFSIW